MNGKLKVLAAVTAAIILSTLVLGCAAPAEKTVQANDWVLVDYTGRYTNGTVFDTSNATIANVSGIYNPGRVYEPIRFQVGQPGIIQGFGDAVVGMKVNETKLNITIPPQKAYGEYNQSALITVPLVPVTGNNTNFSLFLNQIIQYNDEYVYVAAIGANNTSAKIVPLSRISPNQPYNIVINANDTATVDYNNPMAGKTLVFDLTVRAINPSTSPAT